MTVIAVLDWMMPVISVPARTPLIGVPAIRASSARILLTVRSDAVGHELEPEHEDAEPAHDRHEDVSENVDLHGPPVSWL